MTLLIALEQVLNGAQLGVTLFLLTSGLTLVFGIMNLINLAHASLYMLGAYLCASVYVATGSFFSGVAVALAGSLAIGMLIELVVFRKLYGRDHLDQVLATFGVLLFFNELVRVIWGRSALNAPLPEMLSGQIEILPGAPYPVFRLLVMLVGILTGILLYLIVTRTRLGMLIRAGASNRVMAGALGIDIQRLFTVIFGLGAMLAGLAGLMTAPLTAVESGMGDKVLILAFVVIVIGGVGSIRGALIASLLVGLADTFGSVALRPLLLLILPPIAANHAGPALSSILIYILMAAILFFRPQGLFPPRSRGA